MPLFSIIIPTFNSGKTLPTTLASILEQEFIDFEVIIVDSLSSDDTIEVVKNLNDRRVRTISEKDNGIYDAMNKGIITSTGQWVYFIGSDDQLYNKSVLAKINNETDGHSDIIYGNVVSEHLEGVYDGVFTAEKLFHRNICHQAIFLRRNIFEKTGLFDLQYDMLSDWDHNIKWFLDASIRKKYVDLIVANYGGDGLSSKVRDFSFERDKALKFLASSKEGFSRSLKQDLNVEQVIRFKQERNYIAFLIYKIRFWIYRIF